MRTLQLHVISSLAIKMYYDTCSVYSVRFSEAQAYVYLFLQCSNFSHHFAYICCFIIAVNKWDFFIVFYSTYIHWPTKIYFFSKRVKNLYILWSGMISLKRYGHQIFPKLNSFPVIMCWSFKIFRFSRSYVFLHLPKITVYKKKIKILTYSRVEWCP